MGASRKYRHLLAGEWLLAQAHELRLAAPRSLLRGFDAIGEIEKRSRRAIPGTIYAGTSEIQRSLIAESAFACSVKTSRSFSSNMISGPKTSLMSIPFIAIFFGHAASVGRREPGC